MEVKTGDRADGDKPSIHEEHHGDGETDGQGASVQTSWGPCLNHRPGATPIRLNRILESWWGDLISILTAGSVELSEQEEFE